MLTLLMQAAPSTLHVDRVSNKGWAVFAILVAVGIALLVWSRWTKR